MEETKTECTSENCECDCHMFIGGTGKICLECAFIIVNVTLTLLSVIIAVSNWHRGYSLQE